MFNEYVPKVLVVGDADRFRARLRRDNRAAHVAGVALFHGIFEDEQFDLIRTQTFLLDGKLVAADMIRTMADSGAFDYIVFMNYADSLEYTAFLAKRSKLIANEQVLAIDTFTNCPVGNFHAFSNETRLYNILAAQKFGSLLDADGYIAEGSLYIKPIGNQNLRIDGICTREILPIFSNVYDRIYKSVSECALRHYDAILLTAERDVEHLLPKFYEFARMTETFIVFVRAGSPLTKYAKEDRWPQEFTRINYQNAVNGQWFVLHRNEPKDIGLYVVTHKKYDVPLPPEYKTIHAGRALSKDLGYIGDDTGKNISELNPYLNELTAAYWILKNTSHDFVGLSHYRRFFSNKNSREFEPKNILTAEQALNLLKRYDAIVTLEDNYVYNQYGFLINDTGKIITSTALTMTKTMMAMYQPQYVDVFDYVMSSSALYRCNMMITRKHVFDAYYEWLFSFLLEAHDEFMKMMPVEKLTTNQKRAFGYLSERLMNVWLLKNNLRLRELPIMENLEPPKKLEPPATLESSGSIEADSTSESTIEATEGGEDND